ncbi:hypothetical protein GYMLUDRAFT_74432 [Collybiopsis luxurians FD-317 M1]|uniref:Helitron helicase-like domain-containing protein n=1 Tax=Collybiopsis luxurians FD-317 M1 TaxID=944289 RepID=A0A0D0CUM8_9AGAR|nr:hypothetical protein GYMLUDRAFT_74432 [Collybiopsis luxurians FD-317 M1]
MKAFVLCLLSYDPERLNVQDGVLGVVKGYYGCIEAQGQGTLHCHMLIWLEGGLNPNEIKQRALEDPQSNFCKRLINFLEDTISTAVPPKPAADISVPSDIYHPCSVMGTSMVSFNDDFMQGPDAIAKDIHNLVQRCQVHNHTSTCFKYCKDPSQPKECRFGLGPENYQPVSVFDSESGELTLRCLDGLVNNFNETILQAIHCNMDIKFIGSGASAKAVLYYITNYITKSQLKTHIAYAALERAIVKLGDVNEVDMPMTVKVKQLLQKCAYAIISQQELSAQQVCIYLLDLDDHFTSHKFRLLFWTPIEREIEHQIPFLVPHKSGRKNCHEVCDSDHTDLEDHNNIPTDDLDNEEDISLRVSNDSNLLQALSQADDYIFHPASLEKLNLKIARPCSTGDKSFDYSADDEEVEECHLSTSLQLPGLNPLHSLSSIRPKFDFNSGHPE